MSCVSVKTKTVLVRASGTGRMVDAILSTARQAPRESAHTTMPHHLRAIPRDILPIRGTTGERVFIRARGNGTMRVPPQDAPTHKVPAISNSNQSSPVGL